MPLPSPKQDEKEDDFMNRCMQNPVMKKEFPGQSQRVAVCLNQFKKGVKNAESDQEGET
jgi:hypothetical protein